MKKRTKRSWSKEEKLQKLKEAEQKGGEVTIRKYGVYPSTYYSWRKKHLIGGEAGIDDTASKRSINSRHYERVL